MMKNIVIMIMVVCVFASVSALGWETIHGGWCDSSWRYYHLNTNSFISAKPDLFDYYSAIDQVALAAQYWNETGTEFAFKLGYTNIGYCGDDRAICWADLGNSGDAAVTHWDICYCWDFWDIFDIGICDFYMYFNTRQNPGRYKGDPNGNYDFYTTATHEFGHALGLAHNDSEYLAIMMHPSSTWVSMITEDDACGARYNYGLNQQALRFRSAYPDVNNGLGTFSGQQKYADGDWIHESHAQPYIASHPYPYSATFDFALAWANGHNLLITFELIRLQSWDTHQIVFGPVQFLGQTSFQGPSVAVSDDGHILIAYRYEKENPDINTELSDNSVVRLIYSEDLTNWYLIEPSCGYGKCRTQSTPVVAYNSQQDKWILAFNEATNYTQEDNAGEKNSITILVSYGSTPYWWRSPWRARDNNNNRYYSSYLPPALACDKYNGECMITFNKWFYDPSKPNNPSQGYMARIYQLGFTLTGNGSGVSFMGAFEWGVSGFAHSNLAFSPYGWIMTFLDYPGYQDDLSWSYKRYNNGILGQWKTPYGSFNQIKTQQGVSIAYSYRLNVYRLTWTND